MNTDVQGLLKWLRQKQALAAERDYDNFHAICVWTGVKPR